MSGKAHTTKKAVSSEETIEEVNTDVNAEQTTPEEGGDTSGQEVNGKVSTGDDTNFAQMYDMLTERDKTINDLKSQVASLKKENTNLLLKVNASASAGDKIKTPYENFVDSMVNR